MAKIEVVRFENWHAEAVDLRDWDMAVAASYGSRAYMLEQAAKGMAWSMYADQELVGFAGVLWIGDQETADGVAWLHTSNLITEHPLAVFKAVKRGLWEVIEALALDRVYAFTNPCFKAGVKFLWALGFKESGKSNWAAKMEIWHEFVLEVRP